MTPEHRAGTEFRVSGRTLSGVAMPYGTVSPDFRERFVPGAFAPVPAVALNLQHDRRMEILPAGGLVLNDTARALEVRAELPADSAAIRLVQRGALNGFSVEFNARKERREAGVRVIERAELTGLALVDAGAYPQATAEVRARRGRTLRQRIPANVNIGCRCSGVTCKFARITGEAMQEAFTKAWNEAAEILAVRGSYGTPLASKSAGTVRASMDGDDAIVEVDVPDGPDGDAIMRNMADVPRAMLIRPFLDKATSEGVEEAARAEAGENVMVYSRMRVRSLVVGATDEVAGWPAIEEIATPDMGESRAAPERRRRLWL